MTLFIDKSIVRIVTMNTTIVTMNCDNEYDWNVCWTDPNVSAVDFIVQESADNERVGGVEIVDEFARHVVEFDADVDACAEAFVLRTRLVVHVHENCPVQLHNKQTEKLSPLQQLFIFENYMAYGKFGPVTVWLGLVGWKCLFIVKI